MRSKIALICAVPPVCDRCSEEDAKIQLVLPNFGVRYLGENCLLRLVETGLKFEAKNSHNQSPSDGLQ